MFGQPWYFDTFRKLIIGVGTIFNDIVIQQTDANNNVTQTIKVPLTYSAKDKLLQRVKQDPNLNKPTAITLPRLAFEHKNLQYDGTRKLNTVQKVVRKDDTDANKFRYQYNPVPYNIDFSVYAFAKNAEDGTRIVEQILPYFTPEFTIKLWLIPEFDISLDVPVVLRNVTMEDIYEGDLVTRRSIVWTLDFTMKAAFYGPIKKMPIIKFANTNFYFGANSSDPDVSDVVDHVEVSPGMLANGNPTNDPTLTVNANIIEVDDSWDYIVQKSGLIITFE